MNIPKEALTTFCLKWNITELSIFGSSLRDDFRQDSDIDIMVTFNKDAKHTLFHLVRMRAELEEIFDRRVDLVSRRGVEAGRNSIRRDEILRTAETIYVA